MAEDRIIISSEPGISPEEVAHRSFPVVFRGYDQDEVRRLLKRVADELSAARQRENELRRAVDEARTKVAHPELDEEALTAALGEETTRILRSAREAASDMRAKAEERVARMVQEADEHGGRLRLEAENLLAKRVEEADEVAVNIRGAAEADAKAVRDQAQAELEAARARGKEMVAEAQAVRERVINDLSRRRRAAQIQIEQLLAGRDRLIDTYKAVRRTLDEVTTELGRAEDEARHAAELAQRKAATSPVDDSDLAELAEAPAAALAPAPTVSIPSAPFEPAPAPAQDPEHVTPESAPQPAPALDAVDEEVEQPRASLVRVHAVDEEEGVRIIGPAPAPAAPAAPPVEPVTDAPPTFVGAESVSDRPAPPAPTIEEALTPAPDIHAEHPGSVEDLFARLRAERADAVSKAGDVLAPKVEHVEEAASNEPAAAAEVDDGSEAVGASGADRRVLDARDEAIEPLATDLVRRLKRVLQDEQNEILDQLRKNKGRARTEDVLPSAADQAGRYRDAAVEPLADAASKGVATMAAGGAVDDLPALQWAQALADELVSGLRERIGRSLAAGGEDNGSDAADSLGAAYRQWKTERVDQIARHHIASAFNQGALAAAPKGAALRWVFGDQGPCPDCDDNALAGPTAKGEAYPTGQHHPPAHAGCGCVLVLAADVSA